MKIQTQILSPNNAALTCYLLESSPEMPTITSRPAMLIFPGGGYQMCSDREAEPVAMAYLKEGYNAFVLRYTALPTEPTFEKALEDAKASLRYLRENADSLSIDPQKIAVVGFSAGGHLASCMGTIAEEKPNAMVLGYPVILSSMGYAIDENLPGTEQYVTDQTPPAFLFSTQEDSIVPIENTIRFTLALSEHLIPFESHIFVTGDHGLSIATSVTASGQAYQANADVAQWVPLSVKFLKNVWGDFNLTGEPWKLVVDKGVLDQPLKKLHKNPQVWEALCEALPILKAQDEQLAMAMGMSLNQLAKYNPELNANFMKQLEERLNAAAC